MSDPDETTSVSPEGGGGHYRVRVGGFEGPLDLLLHLIQTHELDILDIPIGFITQKYLEYIKMMQEMTIDIASEYLVMAATLTHIKSKMLLPQPPDDEDIAELEEDPRAELIRRLLEYQKYKTAAAELAERSLAGRDVFPRGAAPPEVDGPAPLAAISLYKLIDAFQAVLERSAVLIEHEVDFERISITERITQLSDVLREKRTADFEGLFEGHTTRGDLIVTFLALLEMTRLRMIRLSQSDRGESIRIELAVVDEETQGGSVATLLDVAAVEAVSERVDRARRGVPDEDPVEPE